MQLDARDFAAVRRSLARADELRDELDEKINAVRTDMMKTSYGAVATIRSEQNRAVVISAVATILAAIVGLIFANLVSGGIIRSVRKLLEGTRAVEAGQLDQSIDVATGDEIGQLAAAFNRMVVQLRDNQRVRETFGKYIDPRIVEALIDRPTLTAAEGQRRVMTVMFCDLKGFTSLSEGMTPQGLVKVMNRYQPCPNRSAPTGASTWKGLRRIANSDGTVRFARFVVARGRSWRRTVDGPAQAHRKPQSTAPRLGWVVAHRKIGAERLSLIRAWPNVAFGLFASRLAKSDDRSTSASLGKRK